ncbi:MAG: dihydropteroate synthase [Dysgonamonadaceae bacterium]|jgi:dihydropteroate synthase|nr:dihydropteroate synthase [Dysgonamonadaceae bacterium]
MISDKKYMTANIKGELMDFSSPKVMGILNITPDSFFSGSRKQSESEIAERVAQIVEEGADIIDVGAYSSRPNAAYVDEKEEWNRLKFGLEILFREAPNAIVSIDTFRSGIAHKAVTQFGAAIINDISAGELDANMFDTVAELQIPYLIMHMRGTPQTMMEFTDYKQLIPEIILYFSEKINILHQKGVNDIWLDPGFGFSKNTDQNYELLANLNHLSVFDLPILVGVSRKAMIRTITGVSTQDALSGTVAINMFSLTQGADIIRVHDVKDAVQTIQLYNKIKQAKQC